MHYRWFMGFVTFSDIWWLVGQHRLIGWLVKLDTISQYSKILCEREYPISQYSKVLCEREYPISQYSKILCEREYPISQYSKILCEREYATIENDESYTLDHVTHLMLHLDTCFLLHVLDVQVLLLLYVSFVNADIIHNWVQRHDVLW